MSWIEGNQRKREKKDVLGELKKIKGYLSEKDAKATLAEFLFDNPTFAADLLLGVKIFPFQHLLIKTMFNSERVMGVLGRGSSKCSLETAIVQTDSGLKKIRDVKRGDLVLSKNGFNLVRRKTINEKQKTFGIVTEGGYYSEGLDYHRILVLNQNDLTMNWKFSKNVFPGEIVVMKKGGYNFPNVGYDFRNEAFEIENKKGEYVHSKNETLIHWYEFFGLFIRCGKVGKKNKFIELSTKNSVEIEFLKSFIKRVCKKEIEVEEKDEIFTFRINYNPFIVFLEKLGFISQGKKINHLPFELTNASRASLLHYIRQLFKFKEFEYKEKKYDKVCSISERLLKEEVEQIRSILLMLGIRSVSIRTKNSKKTPLYKIAILDKKSQDDFLGIEIEGQKFDDEEWLKEIVFNVANKEYEKVLYKCRRKERNIFSEWKNNKNLNSLTEINFLSLKMRKRVKEILREDIFLERVSKTYKSEGVTVDLNVSTEHCYAADGFINHNTFSTAIYAALEAVFNQGVKIGVIAASFRQSKLVIQKIEEIMNTGKANFFKEMCNRGVVKSTDNWTMNIGQSSIIALPLGDGEKLRGARFQILIVDEFLIMPERIFNEVIFPFLAVVKDPQRRKQINDIETRLIRLGKMKEGDRTRFPSNKIVLLSSASYKFEYMYKVYCQYEKFILEGGDEEDEDSNQEAFRAIFHMSYDAVPKELYDQSLIKQAKETMSEAQFDREFKSVFTDDSAGYYKMSQMNKCTIGAGEGQSIEIVGDPKAKYILSFDPSWSQNANSDDFAMTVIKLDEKNQSGTIVHGLAIPGTPMNKHILYFLYILKYFNIVFIVGDYNGGVQFLSACNQSKEFKDAGIEIQFLDFETEKPEIYASEMMKIRREYNKESMKICHLKKPTSQWIRQANEMLQKSFDRSKILFACEAIDEEFKAMSKIKIPELNNLCFIKENDAGPPTIIDFIERQKEVVDLTKTECALINPKQSASGVQIFDLPDNLKNSKSSNKARKDSYSSLVLANWAMHIYYEMMNLNEDDMETSFSPIFLR